MKILVLALAAILTLSGAIWAQPKDDCVIAECHADIGTKEFVHGPVGAKICTVCHVKKDGKDHEFNLYLEKEELCLACHGDKRDMMLEEHVHTPLVEGNCVGCHDPHQSDHRYTLKGRAADLCFQCHDRAKFTDEHIHGPVAAGDCNVCHSPHASPNEKQLVDPADKICFRCHAERSRCMGSRADQDVCRPQRHIVSASYV